MHRNHSCDSNAANELFLVDLPTDIQRFAAGWLVRVLVKSPEALSFKNTEAQAGLLFDRLYEGQIYRVIGIEARTQTYEKLQKLTEYLQSILDELDDWISNQLDLDKPNELKDLQTNVLRLIKDDRSRSLLSSLLPRPLISENRVKNLFSEVAEYAEGAETDPIYRRNSACEACDAFERQAIAFGTEDSDRILGGLARQLKAAVDKHFATKEASKVPDVNCSEVEKRYPLRRLGVTVPFKVRIRNDGTGPARDVSLDIVDHDDCVSIENKLIGLGTIQPGESFAFDIELEIKTPSDEAVLMAETLWSGPGGKSQKEEIFTVRAQEDGLDWEEAEYSEPYSLEAVESENELIGRKDELNQLLRLANNPKVSSGYIYGQKRVGKTSLANALSGRLRSTSDAKWVVIYKGSGDYVGSDSSSTLQTLGNVLAEAMRQSIPGLANTPHPDFTNGLAPLSNLVDQALQNKDVRLLFILDEFDELPHELFNRTDLGTSLFQPIRQISTKPGCGFLLVGGENMDRIVKKQGDRLNKFTPVEVGYFDRDSNWSDFIELMRKPAENWLSISDTALAELFTCSAGNPYFAKLLASQLFIDMVRNRDSDASEFDVRGCIANALRTRIRANSFAHFWTDGLIEAADKQDQQQIIRCSVLIAAGRAFRPFWRKPRRCFRSNLV